MVLLLPKQRKGMRSRLLLMFSDFSIKVNELCVTAKVFILLLLISAETAFSFNSHYIVVAKDGSGDFMTITAALDTLPSFNYERAIIFVKNGVYHEKIRIDQDYVTIEGERRDSTIIEYAQLRTDWIAHKDLIGPAVVNIHGDDVILKNVTIKNTQPEIGPHAFAIYDDGTRTIIVGCNLFSKGADTVSPWNYKTGMYYMADCSFTGSVDFVCPRGWCFVKDSKFYEEKKGSASIWHAGSFSKDQKFVLENCSFDGVDGFALGRHHLEAQFYLLNCKFSKKMADMPIYRVVYRYSQIGKMDSSFKYYNGTQFDSSAVEELNKSRPFNWGERDYYYNCHREGGDYTWFENNLESAEGKPSPDQVTPSWTFEGKWDPESNDGPRVVKSEIGVDYILFTFSEPVTVVGLPVLRSNNGTDLRYDSGAGTNTLKFVSNKNLDQEDIKSLQIRNDASITGTIVSIHRREASF
jgi:pectinesterase